MRRPSAGTALSVIVGLLVVVSSLSATVVVAEPAASEEAYVEAAPEKGDPYFEAEASDGSWISYENPRDEYRSPYLGSGSTKMCVTLQNKNGEPIVGESVPNTTITIPTGESVAWHSGADPITVELPLTEHYDRPLDADQFGTSDLPQGDGYLDSHCYEFHGLPEDGTIEYGEAEIDGEHADRLEVVGYIQHAHSAWDSDVDPITDAESYEEAGGGWTFHPGGSHGQVVVVLQLDSEDASEGGEDADETTDATDQSTIESNDESGTTDTTDVEEENDADENDSIDEENDTGITDQERTADGNGTMNVTDESGDVDEDRGSEETETETQSGDQEDDEMPGFGIPVALIALLITALVRIYR